MKFIDLVYYKTAQIMFKAKQNILPEGVQQYFKPQQTKYNLRDENKFIVPKARKGYKQRCLPFVGAQLWNKMNNDIKNRIKNIISDCIWEICKRMNLFSS